MIIVSLPGTNSFPEFVESFFILIYLLFHIFEKRNGKERLIKKMGKGFGLKHIFSIIESTLLLILPDLHNPHFFYAGEEGGGFEAEEFGCAAGAVDFPVGGL